MSVTANRLPSTPEGRAELAAEIACLQAIRRDVLAERLLLSSGTSDGRAAASRHELAAIDEQISLLKETLARLELSSGTQCVALGSRVTVLLDQDARVFRILGPVAANPSLGYVSFESPIARAVLGREVGDEVELIDRHGRQRMRILAAA